MDFSSAIRDTYSPGGVHEGRIGPDYSGAFDPTPPPEQGDLLRSGGGVDPSAPFDPGTTPTSVEGTAAAPFNVDSIGFEGSLLDNPIDSVALNPQPLPPKDGYELSSERLDNPIDSVALNPQPLPPRDGYEYSYEWPLDDTIDPMGPLASALLDSSLFL